MVEGERIGPADGDTMGANTRFTVSYPNEAIDKPFVDEMVLAVRDQGGEVSFERRNQFTLVLLSLLPWILIFGVIWFFIYRQIRGILPEEPVRCGLDSVGPPSEQHLVEVLLDDFLLRVRSLEQDSRELLTDLA